MQCSKLQQHCPPPPQTVPANSPDTPRLLPRYSEAKVVRSRDAAVLDTCTLVVDVGGVFDREKHRYDHHQKTFQDTFNSLDSSKKWVTKLSR